MGTITIKDSTGTAQTAALVPSTGPTTAAANSLPVVMAQGGLVDRSGTITAGGTAQQLMAANTARLGWAIQNNSAGDLWVSALVTAVQSQPSLKIASGVYYESPPGGQGTGAVSIIGATTSQAFTAREW